MSSGTIALPAQVGPSAEPAQANAVWRRVLKRPLAIVCLVFLIGVTGLAIFAPIVLPAVSHQGIGDLLHVRAGPSRTHLLGTDTLGRDVLNRLLVGARVTMLGVAESLIVATIIGTPLGLAAGYLGGRFDHIVAWITDLSFSVPSLIIILVVAAIFPLNLLAMMVTLGLLSATSLARVVRAVTLPVREELYVAAARVSGLSRPYIIAKHVLPRVMGVVIIQSALFAATAVSITAGLAFLGIIDPNTPSWGGMVQDGIGVLQLQPWLIWPPGIAIGLTTLAFTLLGNAVRDATAENWSTVSMQSRRAPRPLQTSEPLAVDRDQTLLSVEHLTVVLPSAAGPTRIIEDVSFHLNARECVGVVGESGCGKTMTAMAILGILPAGGFIESGGVYYNGRDLAPLSEQELERVRGREIALISQEPMVSLTPTFRVGWQIAETVRQHHGCSRKEARRRTIELLEQVRLPEPELVAHRYLHELSGGMAQRVAIARALAGEPKLLIADEPTTALDVTVQSEILDLLRALQQEREMAILLITHDWGVIADLCDRAVVMYAGEVVEEAPLEAMFRQPLHPYTDALLGSNPHHAATSELLPTIPGSVPKPGAWPVGCHFQPRCAYATPACAEAAIPLEQPAPGRATRCIHHEQLAATSTARV